MAFAAVGRTDRAWELFNMINPVNHGSEPADIQTYRVEPYVVAADVYAVEPHVGRGGWTWYTGSAGWMYRLITESLLGLYKDGDRLQLRPRPPRQWSGYMLHYRFHDTMYHITIRNGGSGSSIRDLQLDGVDQSDHWIQLQNDQGDHHVVVQMQ